MRLIKKPKDRSEDAKTKYLYKDMKTIQTNQAQQANRLVTRNLLTSSGEGSKENVSIKEDKLGKPHRIVPHRKVCFSANCFINSMIISYKNLITRTLKFVVGIKHFDS